MSTAREIDEAVRGWRWGTWTSDDATLPPLSLLHCTSAYPCANSDVHLAAMRTLMDLYGNEACVGVSGHWRGIQIDVGAVAMGAKIVERHFTLDRTMKGTDHAASLEPTGLKLLCRDVRVIEEAMGSPAIQVLDCEQSAREKLRGAQ